MPRKDLSIFCTRLLLRRVNAHVVYVMLMLAECC